MGWRGFGFVHHSRTIFCRAAPNPNITFATFASPYLAQALQAAAAAAEAEPRRGACGACHKIKVARDVLSTKVRFGDAKVANREIRVWHGATEMGPWTLDKSKTPPTHLGSCRYLDWFRGILDLSIIKDRAKP